MNSERWDEVALPGSQDRSAMFISRTDSTYTLISLFATSQLYNGRCSPSLECQLWKDPSNNRSAGRRAFLMFLAGVGTRGVDVARSLACCSRMAAQDVVGSRLPASGLAVSHPVRWTRRPQLKMFYEMQCRVDDRRRPMS